MEIPKKYDIEAPLLYNNYMPQAQICHLAHQHLLEPTITLL